MEAAATGEAARLRAAAETLKGELAHLKEENVSGMFKRWIPRTFHYKNLFHVLVLGRVQSLIY